MTRSREFPVFLYLNQRSYWPDKYAGCSTTMPTQHRHGYRHRSYHPNPPVARRVPLAARSVHPTPVADVYRPSDSCSNRGYNIQHQPHCCCNDDTTHRIKTPQPNKVGLACILRSTVSQLPDFKSTSIPIGFNIERNACAKSRRVVSPLVYQSVILAGRPFSLWCLGY